MVRASEMRPHKQPITKEQREAWDNLAKAFGDERYYVEIPSAREIAEAGVKALQDEAFSLMKHEAVKQAFEDFVLICKLCKEKENDRA
jgi:3-methyladenine DNA glycosylase/8-oxoguanine DNA glycosylase